MDAIELRELAVACAELAKQQAATRSRGPGMKHPPRWETAKEDFLNVLTLYAGGFLTWLTLTGRLP